MRFKIDMRVCESFVQEKDLISMSSRLCFFFAAGRSPPARAHGSTFSCV